MPFPSTQRKTIHLLAGVVMAAMAPAWAGSPQCPLAPGTEAGTNDADRPRDRTVSTDLAWHPVAMDRLDGLRGGDNSESNVLIDGLVDGNTADRIVSGDNIVADGAFGQAAGINTVIQNTGSNVLIQAGTAVSVQFAPPTP